MILLSVAVLVYFFPSGSDVQQSYEPGSIWTGDTLRADFPFPIYKPDDLLSRQLREVQDSVLPVFVPTGVEPTVLIDSLMSQVMALDSAPSVSPLRLSDPSLKYIRDLDPSVRPQRLRSVASTLASSLEEPYQAGVIDRKKRTIDNDQIVVRRSDAYEEVVPLKALYDSLGLIHLVETDFARLRMGPEAYAFAMELFQRYYRPTLSYSAELTEAAEEAAMDAVSRTAGIVRQGQVIVAPSEEITPSISRMLESYELSRQRRRAEGTTWLKILGALGHVIILIGLPLMYLLNFRRRIFFDNLQLGIILAATIFIGALAWLSLQIESNLPWEFLILVPFMSMLLAILFDSRTAFYLTVVVCLILAGIRGNDYSVAIACLSAGVLAAYTVRDIRSRTQLFRSIAYSILGFSLAIIALDLERGTPLDSILLELGFAGVNAIISPVLTFGAILLLENFFNVATDLKLLEYDDLNHPLLKMLNDKAPGTYQHTLTIARLAESAATAVGANALQAKVGAYFHDVGKISKPEYFVENQMEMENKHDKIKPEMSAKIIRDHVLDGIKIARQYGLPERIVDFIPTHHGTTQIKYFLDKAKETSDEVKEASYQYPGPLPHSRETAIVMLADAVEATTRSLPEPTPKAIEETVDKTIKKRFADGQLDKCDLTLADLTAIREAFIKNLVGMNHPRIQYKEEKEPAEEGTGNDSKQEAKPLIPYVDDAFSSLDAERGYGVEKPQREDERRNSD